MSEMDDEGEDEDDGEDAQDKEGMTIPRRYRRAVERRKGICSGGIEGAAAAERGCKNTGAEFVVFEGEQERRGDADASIEKKMPLSWSKTAERRQAESIQAGNRRSQQGGEGRACREESCRGNHNPGAKEKSTGARGRHRDDGNRRANILSEAKQQREGASLQLKVPKAVMAIAYTSALSAGIQDYYFLKPPANF